LERTILTFALTKGAPRVGILSQTFGYTVFAIIGAVFVLDSANSTTTKNDWLARALCWAPLRKMGAYSYAAYVFHKPLHQLVGLPFISTMQDGRPASVAVAIAYFIVLSGLVFFIAHISFHVFEKHFLQLKRYFAASN
jgi:peptidoglycan/LPS O-acetylase OafA/YrhL